MNISIENTVADIYFLNSTIRELNEIIETELLKEEADLDLVDECCSVLELINSELFKSEMKIETIYSAEAIIRKYNSQKYKRLITVASCAVILGAFTGAAILTKPGTEIDRGEHLKVEATESIKNETFEFTKQPTTTERKVVTTTRLNEVKTLKVMQPFNGQSIVFENRESINLDDFYIYVECSNGKRFSVIPSECQFEVLETAEDGTTSVRVVYNGFETFINVTVNVEETSSELLTETTGVTDVTETTETVDSTGVSDSTDVTETTSEETTIDLFLEG